MNWKDCLNSDGTVDPAAMAAALYSARRAGATIDVLPSAELGLSVEDAYRVQDQMTALRLAGGERLGLAGWSPCVSPNGVSPDRAS